MEKCPFFKLLLNQKTYKLPHVISNPVVALSPLTSTLGELLGYWAVSGILAIARVGVHRISLRLPYISFSIHSSSPAIEFHSCFFFTTDVHVSVFIRSTLNLLTF